MKGESTLTGQEKDKSIRVQQLIREESLRPREIQRLQRRRKRFHDPLTEMTG